MNTLLNISFTSVNSAITNTLILLFIGLGIYSGVKKGFLESSISFIGSVIALIGAYTLKNPLSVFLYTHLPFFKIGGIFKGVTALNIIIYELIAFLIIFSLLMIIIKIVVKVTGIFDKILSFILFFGVPNKILGALVGFVEAMILLYFICTIYIFSCSFIGINRDKSLMDDIIRIPVLKETFGDSFDSITDIASVAKDYQSINDKDAYNQEALNILMKYDIITCDNVKSLIEDGKMKVENEEELMKVCEK